ncbi:helix-turn-helix domain-containing protein [Arthrobacter sp. FW305-123]|nr:helix-turn-helix domain-containing protein [Arthrobacter sp. FW305-123]
MLTIGAFAQIGQVTHRMLRHWDTAGLLVPAHVDEFSGYRSYDPSQLERLHRIVALRQLGFGLDDISSILDQGVEADRIAALLRIRRAEVEQEHRIAAGRLADVLETPVALYETVEDGLQIIAG